MQRSPGRTTPLLVAILLLAVGGLRATTAPEKPAASSLPAAAESFVRTGLKDLHDGLYAQAQDSFRAAARAAPGDPAPSLFIAFTFWWRILQDRSDRSLDGDFLQAAGQTVEIGERRLEADPDDVRLLSCVGTAHILRSQVEGLRRNFFKAAQEARRGKKALEAALEMDPSNRDVLFGLGAYNYYTEKLPGLARGLLFMPKGDADLGLRQLKAAAASDAYFNVDARLLLALICGSKDEQCYPDALAHLNAALARDPKSPLLLGSIGGVKMRLGYYAEAVHAFEEALAAATGESGERLEQRRILKLYLAEALAADWRLVRAGEILRDVGESSTLPERQRQLFERVATEIAQKGGGRGGALAAPAATPGDNHPPAAIPANDAASPRLAGRVSAALAALDRGSEAEALALLAAAAEAYPRDPLPPFLMGRVHFDRGRFAEAERELAEAQTRALDPPAWMAGWIELYRGLIQKALGHRAAARTHFRAASEIRRFRSAERGNLELQEGVPPHGRCRP